MRNRPVRFALLLLASWVTMTQLHELGHIVAGQCCGGTLVSFDLTPWHLPYSLFEPDPFPLVTLWSGPVLGSGAPLAVALVVKRPWMWFIAHFCLLANGSYLTIAWITGDSHLDTTKLLEHGAHPICIGLFCGITIGIGYLGFRHSCREVWQLHPIKKNARRT